MITEPSATTEVFAGLPDSLVEDLLNKTDAMSTKLSESFSKISSNASEIRKKLENKIKMDSEIITQHKFPTSCGIDGSYTSSKLLSTDIVGIAGVAVEGLTPPSEVRHWPAPRHHSFVEPLQHNDGNLAVAKAIMFCYELQLAKNAPHDVVFIDGSLTTQLIALNQAFTTIKGNKKDVSQELVDELYANLEKSLQAYKEILLSPKSDQIYAAIPKYTSGREISEQVGYHDVEDRALFSFILKPHEFHEPLPRKKPDQPYHLPLPLEKTNLQPIVDNEILPAINDIQILYYRPHLHFPPMRVEVSKSVATSNVRLSVLLESIENQCSPPSLMEPYPTWLADIMVKHMGSAVHYCTKATTNQIAKDWKGDGLGNIFMAMHNYRMESRHG